MSLALHLLFPLGSGSLDIPWVSAVIAIMAGVIGATVGFGRRNTALTDSQAKAVDAAALQITTLQVENGSLRQEVTNLSSRLTAAERRLDSAERMATSRDLILAVAAHFGAPEEILRPYRVVAPTER